MNRRILPLLLACLVLVTACTPLIQASPAGGDSVQIPAQPPVAGGAFNPFFPKTEGDFAVVYTQEKAGFAEAKLNRQGEEVATLAVADTATNPSAVEKFKTSRQQIAGYPAVAVGANGTALLVADRFQVQVRSKNDTFTAQDRAEWLAKFDLSGLAGLK
jgi:hypothetical protein